MERLKTREGAYIPLVKLTLQALEIAPGDLPNRVRTSLTPAGNCPDSPEPILRLSPATGHEAEILDVYDSYVGYDAETFPSQQPQRKMRSTSGAGPLERSVETVPSTLWVSRTEIPAFHGGHHAVTVGIFQTVRLGTWQKA
jgi:hypothetical protein